MTYNYKTRKDNRKRSWPSGTNDTIIKKKYNRSIRKMLKENSELTLDGGLTKKYNDYYEINDFK